METTLSTQQTTLLQKLRDKYLEDVKFLALENSRLQGERQEAAERQDISVHNIVYHELNVNKAKSDTITAFIVELDEILGA